MNGQAGPEEVDPSAKKKGLKEYAQESVLTVPRDSSGRVSLNLQERLLLLDLFRRFGMEAKQIGRIVGLSKQCILRWNERFEEEGPAGLEDRPKGIKRGSRLSEHVQTAILMMKQANPSWGVDRIHQMLMRSDGCYASPGAITKLLKENGYEAIPLPTKRHPDKPRRFERARPGHPLVLKCDNGSSFKSRVVQDFLKKERVTCLPSPPRCPEYNGACEACVGSIKVRAARHAAQDGRPGDWTCDDVEWTRQDANENGRPRGVNRLTPNEAFVGRKEVSEEERDSFRSLVRAYYEREVELRCVKDVDALSREKHLTIHRVAVARTLLKRDWLTIWRRRLTPQEGAGNADNIT